MCLIVISILETVVKENLLFFYTITLILRGFAVLLKTVDKHIDTDYTCI